MKPAMHSSDSHAEITQQPLQYGKICIAVQDLLTGKQGLLHLCHLMHPFHTMQTPGKRSAAYYHLHAQLTAPWEVHNILAEAEAASSTGESTAGLVLSELLRKT